MLFTHESGLFLFMVTSLKATKTIVENSRSIRDDIKRGARVEVNLKTTCESDKNNLTRVLFAH